MTLWYDLTTSLRNPDHNGIASVEWNLWRAIYEVASDARAFALIDGHLVVLDEADPEATFYATEKLAATTAVGSGRATAVAHELGSRFGSTGAAIVGSLSGLNQQRLRASRSLAARRQRFRRPSRDRTQLADVLADHDVVVSLGADWSGELARRLQRVGTEHSCRVVTMVYDLIPLTHTHLAFHKDPALFRAYYTELIAASDLMFCISQESRSQLIEFARANRLELPETRVLRLGDAVEPPADATTRVRAASDYFLWVGTIERRKNLELLYDALRILESEKRDLPTVIVVGSLGWGTGDLLRELDTYSTDASRHMILIGSVTSHDLERLYESARALLFPSLYEGWGLPIREAAIRGVPVAAGDSPAAREAAGDWSGATLIDPDNPEDWADFLLAQSKLEVGSNPVTATPSFLWRDSASELLAAISDLGRN